VGTPPIVDVRELPGLDLPFLGESERLQVEMFVRGAGLGEEHNRALVRWWRCNREDAQGIIDFLISQRVVTSRELRFLDAATLPPTAKNFFPIAVRSRLQIKARELVASHRVETPNPTSGSGSATVSRTAEREAKAERRLCIQSSTKVGAIRIDSLLGEGGYGEVYKGYHERLEIAVAAKFLRPERCSLPADALRQLVAEARLMARLNHPNIVRLWDFDDSHVPPYMVMEFVDGPTVQRMIAENGPFAGSEALKIAREVARALRAAWQLGVVHRDIKPANIILSKEGFSKVTDFGLAVLAQDPTGRPIALKSESGVSGTAEYVAPEAVRGARPTPQSDMYSLGATLYHMVAGKPPFTAETSYQILYQAANKPAPSLSTLVPKLDRGCSKFIHRLLAKHPAERFANYEELFTEIDELIGKR